MLPLNLEEQLSDFESKFGTPEQLSIDQLLTGVDPAHRVEFLAELVLVDLDLRLKETSDIQAGERLLSEYLRQRGRLTGCDLRYGRMGDC